MHSKYLPRISNNTQTNEKVGLPRNSNLIRFAEDRTDIIEALISAGASINVQVNCRRSSKVHCVVAFHMSACANMLIAAEACPTRASANEVVFSNRKIRYLHLSGWKRHVCSHAGGRGRHGGDLPEYASGRSPCLESTHTPFSVLACVSTSSHVFCVSKCDS